jgi:hypothetical protein
MGAAQLCENAFRCFGFVCGDEPVDEIMVI